ncbi:hypothetical protein [Serratia liquefaciens]|uniref:hypothetical protein n=1 Tax=Serratia liquefaciens TaxID=614 RepID=UPI003EC736E8
MIKRFNPDFSLSISHELAYKRESPEGGYVAHGDYATLFSELEVVKAERDALAVENAALKAAGNKMFISAISLMEDSELKIDNARDIKDWERNETPVTDAALAAVRMKSKIEGVEAAANRVGIVSLQYKPGQKQELIKAIGRDVLQYAAELREAK